MIGIVFGKVLRVGRVTVFLVGLAVILALTLGLAPTALAGAGIGAPFNLGKTNTVNAVSKLVGNVAGPTLALDNDSTDANATAPALQVESGEPPMKVNSGAKVKKLNSDRLDSKGSDPFASGTDGKANDADRLDNKDSTDFLPADTYLDTADAVTGMGGGKTLVFTGVPCDPGDRILNAGGGANPEDDMIEERPTGPSTWLVRIRDNGAPTTSIVVANFLDFPPLH